MGNVIDLFTKNIITEERPVLEKSSTSISFKFAPREMWEKFTSDKRTQVTVPPDEILEHTVTILEVSRAFYMAWLLTKDREALAYFKALEHEMIDNNAATTYLGYIPPQLRGYVWSPNMKELMAVANHITYDLATITGLPFTRHIFI